MLPIAQTIYNLVVSPMSNFRFFLKIDDSTLAEVSKLWRLLQNYRSAITAGTLARRDKSFA